MGPVDVTDPRTQVDLAALERAHAQQVVQDTLVAPAWTVPARAGGDHTDGDGDTDGEGGTNSEGDDYDPDQDPDADPDTLDPQRHNRPETD